MTDRSPDTRPAEQAAGDLAVYPAYLAALLRGDRAACRQIVANLLEQAIGIRSLYVDLFQRALYDIGALWAQNRISVEVEHCATAITESLFPLVYPHLFMAEHCGRRAVVSCVANEFHQIGGKMVADILEMHGWDTLFLGANTGLTELVRHIDEQQPDLVALSLSLSHHLPVLLTSLTELRRHFPLLPLIVGGQGFAWADPAALATTPQLQLIRSLAELETYVTDFAAQPLP
ncbi:cobalamin B12-binding domain-containing protein [Desulfuromonas thiophila]|uniref:cobalamin B12-binding domain-containing protein n=1 Tax=Desulfuromonas thiophila TaxID=57664 RepID=UPI0024A832F1|nr:cobalamin-dependent protein [Desulfuromonas thiophila]